MASPSTVQAPGTTTLTATTSNNVGVVQGRVLSRRHAHRRRPSSLAGCGWRSKAINRSMS
jgi:hypothetical protein